MKWAVIVFSLLTVFCLASFFYAQSNVEVAEDNWNTIPPAIGVVLFGVVDFVLIIVWLAIT